GHLIDLRGQVLLSVFFDRAKQLAKSLLKNLYAVFEQLVGDLFHRNPGPCQVLHGLARAFEVCFQTLLWYAVIAEAVEGGRRNSVNRVWSDEFFDVKHIAISWILGAGGSPQQPLCLCTSLF